MSGTERIRVSLVCDKGGCWQPALKATKQPGDIVCLGHAIGVLD